MSKQRSYKFDKNLKLLKTIYVKQPELASLIITIIICRRTDLTYLKHGKILGK